MIVGQGRRSKAGRYRTKDGSLWWGGGGRRALARATDEIGLKGSGK